MNELIKKDKKQDLITIKEFADVMGVDVENIKFHIRNLYPDKMKHGITTYLTTQEVSEIKAKMIRTSNTQVKLVSELEQVIRTTDDLKKLSKEDNLKIGLTALQNVIADLQNENTTIKKENKDFKLISSNRISKNEIRTRIVEKINEISNNRKDYKEQYKKLYEYFKFQHPNINFYEESNKLDYLIKHGYGDELLEILIMKFGG
jgi:hypothetical protein